jgi:hypothetical protein
MTYKFCGTTDEITTCDCCGKSNLKKTVVLQNENGDYLYYGVDCAARTINNKTNGKAVLVQAQAVDYAKTLIAKYGLNQKVANAVWNKFGFGTEIKNDHLKIGNFAIV